MWLGNLYLTCWAKDPHRKSDDKYPLTIKKKTGVKQLNNESYLDMFTHHRIAFKGEGSQLLSNLNMWDS